MLVTQNILKEAIKCVGVGKKGSKELSPELIDALIPVLKSPEVSQADRGAFIGALMNKGVTDQEKKLEQAFESNIFSDHSRLVSIICVDAPLWVQDLCVRLLKSETLDLLTAEKVGDFLMSDAPGDGARGMIASILRVRYETPEEYDGILKSIAKTFQSSFVGQVPAGQPIIQIAEPFDGVDHSNMITPLVAEFLQNQGYRVVSMCGRNSGPKFGNNLFDVAQRLKVNFLKRVTQIDDSKPVFGFYINQKDLSSAMDRWVDIRHQTVKRPFMSTVERFVNPFQADICIASAFHPPYGEKMLTIAEKAGFPKVIIIRNGIEGTAAFALKRPTKILCSVKRVDGIYERQTFEFDPEVFLGFNPPVEEVLEQTSPDVNALLIKSYQEIGKTSNELFDMRIKVTCAGLFKALEFVNS